MIFTRAITVNGQNFYSSYCFENDEQMHQWIKEEFPVLAREKKHKGKLTFHTYSLDGLKIGDRCHVCGEGNEVFTILGLRKYSKDRYGFELDNGFTEEVVKCSKVDYLDIYEANERNECKESSMSMWRDIQTAPKDGTLIFLAHKELANTEDEHMGYISGRWVPNYGCPAWFGCGRFVEPVYWMPIPELPK